MAYTAAEIQAKVVELEKKLTAVEATSFADRSVKYRSVNEIKSEIAYWNGQLASLQGRSGTHFAVGNSGFNY